MNNYDSERFDVFFGFTTVSFPTFVEAVDIFDVAFGVSRAPPDPLADLFTIWFR